MSYFTLIDFTAFGLPRDHIEIAADTPAGKLIAETTADYVPALSTHSMKKRGGVRFPADLDQTLPSTAIIKGHFIGQSALSRTPLLIQKV